MKVFFDIGFHDSTNPDGIARYTRELIRSFKTIGQNEIYFIRRSAHIYLAQSKSDPSIFDQPLVINSGDLLIMPSLDTGLFEASSYLFSLRAIGVSIISLIPDLIAVDYPEFFPAGNNQIILRHFALLNDVCTKIIVPSSTVLKKIEKFQIDFGLQFTELKVGFPGTDHLIRDENKGCLPNFKLPYVLFISTLEPRKRQLELATIIDANREIFAEFCFIFVGKIGWLSFKHLKSFRSIIDKNSNLILHTNLTDPEMINLLQGCSGLIMLSVDEGYGLPIMEAAFFNKPIFCSDIPVFREITNGKAFLTNNTLENLKVDLEVWLSKLQEIDMIASPNLEAKERTWDQLAKIWLGD